jgi:hypothetical protein
LVKHEQTKLTLSFAKSSRVPDIDLLKSHRGHLFGWGTLGMEHPQSFGVGLFFPSMFAQKFHFIFSWKIPRLLTLIINFTVFDCGEVMRTSEMYSQNETSQGLEAGFAADTGAWLPCVSALVSFMRVNHGDKYIDRLD